MRALEAARLHGAPSCRTCTDRMKRDLGCKKPGQVPQFDRRKGPVTFTSPILLEKPQDRVMLECPTGYILREAPWVYDALDVASLVENASPQEYCRLPLFVQQAARLYRTETERLREARRGLEQAKRDSQHGKDVRKRYG